MPAITYEKWLDDLERIQNEITVLHYYRQIWRDLAEITQNADLPETLFFPLLGNWYSATQTVAIRRQVDMDRGVVSLWRLLQEISQHPARIDRARHVALWDEDESDGHQSFDRFTAKPGDHFIDRKQVTLDQQRIRHQAAVVISHVDTRIAHSQAEQPKADASPTYGDIDGAIDTLASVFRKYVRLLRAADVALDMIVIDQNWKKVFTKPWLTGPPWDGSNGPFAT
jgi:hypothetical protein